MAVYNGEKYLDEAIESILSQTFRDFEFIIINDASTDNTECIIEKYLQLDGRILKLNNTINQERAESRNSGLKIAKGEYVSIIDSDDISLPEKLERQVRFLDEHCDVGFVGTSWFCVDENGVELSINECSESISRNAVHFMCNPSILARKSCLEIVGGYRPALVPAEDYDLWLRVSENKNVSNVKDPLFKYRIHGESSTALQKLEMDFSATLAIEMAEERRTGLDTLSALSIQEVERIKYRWRKSSEIAKRKMLSHNYSTWCHAAFALGEHSRALGYAKSALKSYPGNFHVWGVILRIGAYYVICGIKELYRGKG